MTLLWTFLTILAMLSFEPALAFVTPSPRTFEHTRLSVSTKSDEMSNSSLAVIEYNDFLPRPHPDLSAMDVVQACMTTLIDHPDHGEGLEVCFDFSSDRCRVRTILFVQLGQTTHSPILLVAHHSTRLPSVVLSSRFAPMHKTPSLVILSNAKIGRPFPLDPSLKVHQRAEPCRPF